MSGHISVLIAEDCLLVRDSIYRALSTDAEVTVVGVAEDYDSTVELVEKHQPAAAFDVRMPPRDLDEGIPGRPGGCARLSASNRGDRVVAYADYAAGLLDGGTAARGYLLRAVSHFDQLSEAVSRSPPVGRCSIRWCGDAARPAALHGNAEPIDPQRTRGARRIGDRLSKRTVLAQRRAQRAVESHQLIRQARRALTLG